MIGKRLYYYSRKGVRKGEELKALRYASAVVIYNYIIIYDIIPNNSLYKYLVKLNTIKEKRLIINIMAL